MGIRLEKFLAERGICSRRLAKQYVVDGRVKINGKQVFIPGRHIDQERDLIRFNGRIVSEKPTPIYLMLNKPEGYITSVLDQYNRPTVMDLVDMIRERVYPVGRLDLNTEGLLIFTNDGNFSHQILHPSNKIKKTYLVWVDGSPSQKSVQQLREGIRILSGKTAPAIVHRIGPHRGNTHFKLILYEGKKRQIRRMFEAIGHKVLYLKRVRIGNLSLGNLPIGKYRYLKQKEVASFQKQSGLVCENV